MIDRVQDAFLFGFVRLSDYVLFRVGFREDRGIFERRRD